MSGSQRLSFAAHQEIRSLFDEYARGRADQTLGGRWWSAEGAPECLEIVAREIPHELLAHGFPAEDSYSIFVRQASEASATLDHANCSSYETGERLSDKEADAVIAQIRDSIARGTEWVRDQGLKRYEHCEKAWQKWFEGCVGTGAVQSYQNAAAWVRRSDGSTGSSSPRFGSTSTDYTNVPQAILDLPGHNRENKQILFVVGVGDGTKTAAVLERIALDPRNSHVVLVDGSEEMLEVAKQHVSKVAGDVSTVHENFLARNLSDRIAAQLPDKMSDSVVVGLMLGSTIANFSDTERSTIRSSVARVLALSQTRGATALHVESFGSSPITLEQKRALTRHYGSRGSLEFALQGVYTAVGGSSMVLPADLGPLTGLLQINSGLCVSHLLRLKLLNTNTGQYLFSPGMLLFPRSLRFDPERVSEEAKAAGLIVVSTQIDEDSGQCVQVSQLSAEQV